MKTCVVGTHLKHLIEVLLGSTHNICYLWRTTKKKKKKKKRKSVLFSWKSTLSGAMDIFLFLHKNIPCRYSLEVALFFMFFHGEIRKIIYLNTTLIRSCYNSYLLNMICNHNRPRSACKISAYILFRDSLYDSLTAWIWIVNVRYLTLLPHIPQ